MGINHFRLVFKRSQSLGPGPGPSPGSGPSPTFSLTVSAEMTPEFADAAYYYGIWNQIVFADPKLDEARKLRTRESEMRKRKTDQRNKSFFKSLNLTNAPVYLSAFITYKAMKLIYLGPFKLIWWLYCAFRSQNTQIMRFHELAKGKTITAQTLTEIIEAEEVIKQTTEEMENYIMQALNYGGEAFDARREV